MGGPPGDLYVRLRELEHPVFKREGYDLYVDRRIKFTEAILGTKVTVPTLDGKTMSLKVPPGTQSHTKMRLKNYGLPRPMARPGETSWSGSSWKPPPTLPKSRKPSWKNGQRRAVAAVRYFFSCQWSAFSFRFLGFCFAFKLLPSFVGIPSLSQPTLKLATC